MSAVDVVKPSRLTASSVGERMSATTGLLVAVGIAFLIYRATQATGFYWLDDYGHVLMSRAAWHHQSVLLNFWGRPLMTLAYMPASLGPEILVRLTTVLLTTASAGCCWLIARREGRYAAPAAALFVLAQPLTTTLGYSALTETVFSFVLAAALLLRAYERPVLAALVLSLLPLARTEGAVVLVIWAFVLAYERRFQLIPLLGIGVFIWAAAGAAVYGDPLWILHANPYGGLGSSYGAAGWGYLFQNVVPAFGVVIVLALGVFVCRPLTDWLVPALMCSLFAFYFAAWGLPAFDTIGSPVYLVSVSVPVALCASATLDTMISRRRPRYAFLGLPLVVGILGRSTEMLVPSLALVAIFVILPRLSLRVVWAGALVGVVASLGLGLYRSNPLRLSGGPLLAKQLANQLGPAASRVSTSTTPAFAWYAPTFDWFRRAANQQPASSWSIVRHLPARAEIVWDSNVGAHLFGPRKVEQLGFRIEERRYAADGESLILFVRR